MRFINSTSNSPVRQLDIVLELRPPINHDLPFAELDTLYTYILSCTKDSNLVLRILGVYSLVNEIIFMDFEVVEFILGLEDGDICICLGPLSSLLQVETDIIYYHHTSFRDFLQSPERSKSYYINPGLCYSLISQRIFEIFPSIGMFLDLQSILCCWDST